MDQQNHVSSYPCLKNDGMMATDGYMFMIVKNDGTQEIFNTQRLKKTIHWACAEYQDAVDSELILKETIKNIFDGASPSTIANALILSASGFIERDPAYSKVAVKLQLKTLFKAVTGKSIQSYNHTELYRTSFIDAMHLGVEKKLLDPRLLEFDLTLLAHTLDTDRDMLFDYMGMSTLYKRYFLKYENNRIELPQSFWMRIAMGLCYNEKNKNEAAIQFYHTMSQLNYVPSTPTLLHAGLTRPQLSSCFLSTVEDDLHNIFKSYADSAQLAKWSGGVAVDWSNIRACGSMVKSIKTESQGVIPYLKINNDVVAAINRSGKRRSAAVVYLETWHLEIEDFIDLRKNTGDERRRTHDINTAHWIPDLFMKRMIADQEWTLFSPDETPDLHDLYGQAFENRYKEYEDMALLGKIKLYKKIPAKQLWRKMLSRLFETGHPWITFKDPSNIRSPQDHAGVIHSSNLCTEVLLNTTADEIAVCNLGSINISHHIINKEIDLQKLEQTVNQAIRMLDNVIDINYYPVKEAETANMNHRPIGLGVMGFQDALYKMDINFNSQEALTFADELMEYISYHAIFASSKLAKERGAYTSYKGSKWDRNIFPIDTIDLLEQERGEKINVERAEKLDWRPVREHVQQYGMRNSNTMAIAPTATIANIAGVFPSIEPIYKNIYVKTNMSGEFTIVNHYLINDLKKLGLWNEHQLELIKYYDGNLDNIENIPQHLKEKYQEAFAIDPLHQIAITAARGKWVDQSISHNVFMQGVSGKKLHDIYTTAWTSGLKTTYYLRTLGASQIEKSTLDANKFGYTQKRIYKVGEVSSDTENLAKKTLTSQSQNSLSEIIDTTSTSNVFIEGNACSLSSDPDCEACQ